MKVLIVEDMEKIRKGIVELTKRYANREVDIYEANDGLQGLQMYEQYNPDIVITDIRMPNMDGLELTESICQKKMKTQFIIITGFEEFEYAKKALDLGVISFVLKPIDQKKFKEAISKAIDNIDAAKNVQEIMKDNVDLENTKQLNDTKRKIFASLIGKDKYKVEDENFFYNLIYINLGELVKNRDNILSLISNILGAFKLSSQYIIVENFINYREVFIILFHTVEKKMEIDRKIIVNTLYVNKKMSEIYVSSSDNHQIISNTMYIEVKDKMVEEIFSDKVQKEEKEGQNFLKEHLKIIKENILREDYEKVKEEVRFLFDSDYTTENPQIRVKVLFNLIMAQIFDSFALDQIQEIEPKIFDYDSIFDTFQTKEEVKNKLVALLNNLIQQKKTQSVNNNYLECVKEYIDNNFTDNITINMLSEKYNISSSRLSVAFKKEYQQSPYKYITSLRMQLACELLRTTTQHIDLIARTSGYSDVQHFYRVFKKEIGKTPLNYRQDKKEK